MLLCMVYMSCTESLLLYRHANKVMLQMCHHTIVEHKTYCCDHHMNLLCDAVTVLITCALIYAIIIAFMLIQTSIACTFSVHNHSASIY